VDGPLESDRETLAERDDAAGRRDRIAEDRDERADDRSRVSTARDERADARDRRAEVRDRVVDAEQRSVGAAADRDESRRDRRDAASDRDRASDDRQAASDDRHDAAEDRQALAIDHLTGARRRELGFLELEREIVRARRMGHPFALVFVDVDRLKATNDSAGHAAGDRLLKAVADSIRTHLREYDLIVRVGGDEFVCGLPEMTRDEAVARFALVDADLAASAPAPPSVSTGFAELKAEDGLDELIARADEDLYRVRRERRGIDT